MNINFERLDPAFYIPDGDAVVVWEAEGNPYYVLRCGEMRIHAVDKGKEYTIRTTADLESFGISNDADLAEWEAKGEEAFCWSMNAWFEVRGEGTDEYSEPFHWVDDAITYAKNKAQRPDTNNQPAD